MAESGGHSYPSYPPPPGPALTRELSVESSHSHCSPGPERRQQHRSCTPPYPSKDSSAAYPGGGGRESGCSSYPASREPAYPTSRDRFLQNEQQHLLAYRSSPTPFCKHGGVSDLAAVGAADYVSVEAPVHCQVLS